jgi:aspartate/methionine/tyrosine aminotransferase
MLTPNGQCALKLEKVMLLAIWAYALNDELKLSETSKEMIFAGLGKPTYPINSYTISSYLSYWEKIDTLAKQWHLNPEAMQENAAIDYGDPHGDYEPRTIMAEAMSSWYDIEIKPEHILFTVGGVAALRVIFETFNTRYSDITGYRIITPFPHYSAYSNNHHRLHPIETMHTSGYKLLATEVKKSIKEAYELAKIDHGWPKAILICNPSNPLGNFVDKDELIQIAAILRRYPDLYIIFDEAYVEMCFVEMPSFLKIAPDLRDRTIIMRSATKALSAAGERMAMLIVFDQKLMSEILNKNISYFVHAPRSSQIVYAQTMASFDIHEQEKLIEYYKKKVNYVITRLHSMGANMPDPMYKVEATFYALGDFSDLFGLELPLDVSRVLQRTGKITTDEELVYYLLFTDGVMLTPLSYFGLSEKNGFLRITCSGTDDILRDLMDRLESRLFQARKNMNIILLKNVAKELSKVKKIDSHLYETLTPKICSCSIEENDNCSSLKSKNFLLKDAYYTLTGFIHLME